ncbi:abortive infection family protein [Staphylococcus felis]|uniref:Abortive infection family protein n=1 Tax=Staphylococcus felis TaxID=46127 RepID=A0ABS0QQR3_9STAP|nr:abortive infection family protein [Staphylococcus felis]MBH9581559.1 abortive infection family protein [Staphylococcus felis]MDM8326915.1 abortive infection family protein [Staphylococcus felis]
MHLNSLDEVRNEYGDAHGKCIKNYRQETRHAILAVNAARTLTEFLLTTYEKNNAHIYKLKSEV